MRLPSWLNATHLSWFGCLLCLSSLSSSKALQSISIGVLGAGALWQLWEAQSLNAWKSNRFAWWLTGIFVLTFLSYFLTSDLSQWSRDMKGKVLFVAIPLALGGMIAFSARLYRLLWYAFILSQTIVAAISLGRYFAHFDTMNEAIGKNANIDIVGNMSHIYFGLILALSIVLGLYLVWRFKAVWWAGEKYLLLILVFTNIVFLHLLTSRTGLLTFYVGLLTMGIYILFQHQKKWPVLALLTVLLIGPVLSYQFVPSFRQRIDVTVWDVQQFYYDSETASDYSLASRFFAWETAWNMFVRQPLTGIGLADIETEMLRQAPENIPTDKRLNNPHNQYLEYAAAFGILGWVWLGGMLLLPWWDSHFRISWLAPTFISMFATGMVFESLLERQVGICLFCFFVYLLIDFQRIEAQ